MFVLTDASHEGKWSKVLMVGTDGKILNVKCYKYHNFGNYVSQCPKVMGSMATCV